MTALLGALEQETDIPCSANYGAQRNLINNLFQDLGFIHEDNAAHRLSTLPSIPSVSVAKQELESNLPTPGVPFAPLYKTACPQFCREKLTSAHPYCLPTVKTACSPGSLLQYTIYMLKTPTDIRHVAFSIKHTHSS